MEYKKEKRTKNLTLRDIHVGDWVQEWNPIVERYSPPMKVSCINYDGTVYLVPDDENYCTPYETEIENVDALPITPELLKGFGFELRNKTVVTGGFVEYIFYGNVHVGHLYSYLNGEIICSSLSMVFKYMHEMCFIMCKYFPNAKLEWKVIEK